MHEIMKIKESFLSMQICTTIPPNQKDIINAELRNSGLGVSGTMNGWVLDEEVEPVECAEQPGRWHYICVC